MTAPRKTPDRSRRSARSRRAIFDAALALIGEVGYAATTIEGIAAKAGVGKQTIYRWWPSKAAVLLDAFLDLGDQAAMAAGADDRASAIPDSGDLEADLKLVLRATVDELGDPKYDLPFRALAAEGAVNEDLGVEVVERLLRPQRQLYVERLRAAREAGQLREDSDLEIAVDLLVSPLAQRWLQRTGPVTHEYAEALVEHVLRGLTR
ncbi:TetR/AcrR family transcriptional regulator [Saccharothrix coeruleofusca]|uniref:TetR family transcriptional regulator n=1 Tax=Saccharothrix coeruleofusca TaxID=33919 RepID=A0A918ALA3_9PSEU|nr:TetR/AcrR family transcriptional regulator [Saccharothrix coeruleofusca]MBP2336528.1 AcrR family transcriptional regulator [Saccharothrix coeruleofusca]GGP52397.1 TetR family transcriptional regulator [Saccharothrix coeruleofusca]